MKMAARNPAMSPTMPPPNAITTLERSPPRCTISSAADSTCVEPFALFAAGQEDDVIRQTLKTRANSLPVELPNVFRGDDEDLARARRQELQNALQHATFYNRGVPFGGHLDLEDRHH